MSWDGKTVTGTPAGNLLNVTRGLGDTSAASHATTNSIYNAWIDEQLERVTSQIDDALPNYDPFPDIRSVADPTPATIQLIAEDLVIDRAFVKIGIDRSDNEIQNGHAMQANARLAGLASNSIMIEPREFSESLTFGGEDHLLSNEAALSKKYLDPWTASITNAAIKFVPGSPDEQPNTSLPERVRSSDFTSIIKGFIFWSDLTQRWIFRSLVNDIANGTVITYKFTEHRLNWAQKRHVEQVGGGNIIRG